MAQSYDELPYGDIAYFHTHPAHLGALAVLCGLAPPTLTGGRVLEVGCGTGFNLLAMSRSLPETQFLGLDASSTQIDRARALADEVGATNASFQVGRLEELDDATGPFDVILAHGVYSWIPPAAQTALLELIRRRLAPNGLAYISFNAKPGWNARGVVRDFLLGAVPADGSPIDRARAARERLAAFVASLPDPDSPYGRQVASLAKALADEPDYYLLHEYLAERNEALAFGEFAARLAAHGLQYVAESRFSTSAFAQLGADRTALDVVGDDLVRREQYHDYRWQRSLRQSIVCRADRAIPRVADAEAVGKLWLSPRVELVDPNVDVDATDFDEARREEDGEVVQIHDPFYRQFLRRLRAAPGRRLQPDSFLSDIRDYIGFDIGPEKSRHLLMQVVLKGTIEEVWHAYAEPTVYAAIVGDRPRACPLVRRQAGVGGSIVNRLHRGVRLDDADRARLTRLDGRTDRATLAAEFGIGNEDLERFAAAALLEG
ncbi:MAG: class I SAM-dependent methyltransferase [Planctomycetia bacterium]|nr:class I SAM-dependent methyltransferase [Planctomycetia bacterium]